MQTQCIVPKPLQHQTDLPGMSLTDRKPIMYSQSAVVTLPVTNITTVFDEWTWHQPISFHTVATLTFQQNRV